MTKTAKDWRVSWRAACKHVLEQKNRAEKAEADNARLTADLAVMRDILGKIYDKDDCQYDNHGHCSKCGWMTNKKCPYGLARQALDTGEGG